MVLETACYLLSVGCPRACRCACSRVRTCLCTCSDVCMQVPFGGGLSRVVVFMHGARATIPSYPVAVLKLIIGIGCGIVGLLTCGGDDLDLFEL